MSLRNVFSFLLVGTLLALNSAWADEAQPQSQSTTNKPAFNASLRSGETVGNHQVQRAFLTIDTNQIAFMVPQGFFMDASTPGKIVLSDDSGSLFITVRVSHPQIPAESSPADFFKAEVLHRFPGAKISSQSSDFAANHSGPAFELEWAGPKTVPQWARIAFIPSAAGVLEFSVLSRASNFKDAQTYLSVVMASVRSNETGKLVIEPLPNFS